jgi:hypothetical protein
MSSEPSDADSAKDALLLNLPRLSDFRSPSKPRRRPLTSGDLRLLELALERDPRLIGVENEETPGLRFLEEGSSELERALDGSGDGSTGRSSSSLEAGI